MGWYQISGEPTYVPPTSFGDTILHALSFGLLLRYIIIKTVNTSGKSNRMSGAKMWLNHGELGWLYTCGLMLKFMKV